MSALLHAHLISKGNVDYSSCMKKIHTAGGLSCSVSAYTKNPVLHALENSGTETFTGIKMYTRTHVGLKNTPVCNAIQKRKQDIQKRWSQTIEQGANVYKYPILLC